LLGDNHLPCEFKSESPSLLATATLSAITRFTIVHRAIFSRFLAAWLVCCETDCANRGCQNREQNFEMILHNQPSLASIAKASEKKERRYNLRTQRRELI
jgi:hypothetical protein